MKYDFFRYIKKNMYTSEDFSEILRIAIFITIIEWCGYVFLSIWENVELLDNLRSILILIWVLIVPIVVMWWWVNCIKCYLFLKVQGLGAQNKLSQRIWIYIGLIIMIYFGNAVWHRFSYVVDYITDIWKIADGLYDCINMKIGIFIGWLFCFACSVWGQKIMSTKGKIATKLSIIIFAVASAVCLIHFEESKESYIYERTEDVWYHKMVEYYELHEGEVNVEPFSSN